MALSGLLTDGVQKVPPSLKSVLHVQKRWNSYRRWHSYTLSKEDPKNKRITWHTTWVLLCDISIFSLQINKFCYIINMVTILMISVKLPTSGLLKIKIFQNKGYNVVVLDYDVTNKIFLRNLNYMVDVIMWPKFGSTSISIKEFIITSIL